MLLLDASSLHSDSKNSAVATDTCTYRLQWIGAASSQPPSYCQYPPGYLPFDQEKIYLRRLAASLWFRVDTYQSIVRRKPSANFTCGSQPSNFLVKELSATRFRGPVGISG